MTGCDSPDLRRALLAVAIGHGLDLAPDARGACLPAPAAELVSWAEWAAALDGAGPASCLGRDRLARYARARLVAASGIALVPRPFAIPAGHPSHPGARWIAATVPGGILHLGVGVAGLHPDPGRITPLPPGATGAAEDGGAADLAEALAYLERMAELAVARLARRPDETLRPIGDCDVLTLLAARTFRAALVAQRPGSLRGLRTAAVPSRDRGWLDLRRIDPEFVTCAAALTEPDDRGFDRPLLVTADELVLAGPKSGYPRPVDHPQASLRRGHRS